MMLTGKRVKITKHRLEVLRKGLLTEQATMKSLCFDFSTPHATYLENGRRQHMASGQHNGRNKKYKCTSKTRHEEHEVDLGDVRVYM